MNKQLYQSKIIFFFFWTEDKTWVAVNGSLQLLLIFVFLTTYPLATHQSSPQMSLRNNGKFRSVPHQQTMATLKVLIPY